MRLSDLRDRHVAVWGAGVEGAAAVQLLQRHAKARSITVVVDAARPTDPTSLGGVPVLDLSASAFPAEIDAILKSPGISPYHGGFHRVVTERRQNGRPVSVFGGTALWFAEAAVADGSPLARTIAVTGSKGKSTTSSLIAHLLSALTDDVLLAGNVGRAPLDVLASGLEAEAPFPAERWHVLELSSFQSSEVQHSPRVGVLTSLFEEHLDWHETVERYFADKINLFGHPTSLGTSLAMNVAVPDVEEHVRALVDQTPGLAAVPYGGSHGFAVGPGGTIVDQGRRFIAPDGLRLTGLHNAANVCGALTALRCAGWEPWDHHHALCDALSSFQPLEHRLQPVGTVRGRLVIDDSLSTAPQAAIAALAAFAGRPVGIVIGGHDRGLDYAPLAQAVARTTSSIWVAAVPESGPRIAARIAEAIAELTRTTSAPPVQVSIHDDFDSAIVHLDEHVPDGGVLLLSPAAPSFGRFTDYRQRGLHFRSLLGL